MEALPNDFDTALGTGLIDHGSIEFTMHHTAQHAEYLLAKDDVSTSHIAKYMQNTWDLSRPGMLCRVVGTMGSGSGAAPAPNNDLLEGIVHAVSHANGYIFTNGLNFGVTGFVGDCIGKQRHRCQAPLIGVASWASVQGREQLMQDTDKAGGRKRKYRDAKPDSSMSTVSLQSVHTHFVLVKGNDTKLQAVSDLAPNEQLLAARIRSFTFAHALEEAVASADFQGDGRCRRSRVLMVIGGDLTTAREVLEYVRAGRGTVLLAEGSGGLAKVLSGYLRGVPLSGEWVDCRDLDEVRKLVAKISDTSQLLITSTSKTDKKGVMEAILDAAMLQATTVEERMRCAVEWDDADRLQTILSQVDPWDEDRTQLLRDALQLSLELQRESCVDICIKNAAPVKAIHLLGLYDLLFDELNPPLIFLFKGQPKPTVRLQAWQGGKREEGLMADLDDPVYQFYPVEVWALLHEVVPGLCNYWRKKLAKATAPASISSNSYTHLEDSDQAADMGPRWLDIYVWAVVFGKTELAQKLLPACREPMRAAVLGAKLCTSMAEVLPLHAVSMHAASSMYEHMATDLLDVCESADDAWRMLVTKSKVWTKPLLQMAVQSDLRDFCSHVQCQSIGDEWLYGHNDLSKANVVLNGTDIPIARLFIHVMIPFSPPFFKKMITWRAPPGMTISDQPPPFYAYYSIPQVKFIVRFTMHLIFTILVSISTVETDMSWIRAVEAQEHLHQGAQFAESLQSSYHAGGGLENYATDLILWLWTVSLCFDEFYKYAQGPSTFRPDGWNMYDYGTFAAVQFGLAMRFLSIQGSVESMCFAVVLVWMRLFKYLQLDYNLGVLVIILMRMTKDIAMWATLSMIILIAFTVAFVSIADPYVIEQSGEHPMTAPLWAMLGSFDVGEFADWNPSIGKPMLWLYVVFSNIVFINLLIAMMGYTFSNVMSEADREWKFGRLRSIIEINERFSALPPPFNLPLTLYTFVTYCARKLSTGSGTQDDREYSEAELHEMKVAKKAKAKAARRLIFALKRRQEDMADKLTATVQQTSDEVATMRRSIVELQERLAELKETTGGGAAQLSSRGTKQLAEREAPIGRAVV